VLCCRREPPESLAATPPRFAEPAFQALLATLAQQHGVYGLLLDSLERSGLLAALPREMALDYQHKLRLLRRQAALWDLERDLVLSVLEERGIRAVLLKGAALRLTAYTNSVQRSFGDLDVLVSEEAVDEAVNVLGAAGYQAQAEARARLYRQHHHHVILHKPMGFVVEVHWALEPVHSPFALDPAAFRERAVPYATREGQSVLVPSAEHNVLHLSTQSMEDGYSRFTRIVDLDRLLGNGGDQLDWGGLGGAAIRMRVNHVVALSLRLAELLLGTPIPAGFFERLELAPLSRTNLALLDPIAAMLEQRSQRRAALERLLVLWCVQGRAARVAVVRAIYWGEPDWFARMGFLQDDTAAPLPPRRRPLAVLKLLGYQLWIYLVGTAAWLGGRRRISAFWKLRPPL
jgi:putative nucleotidyltransferase-like protein